MWPVSFAMYQLVVDAVHSCDVQQAASVTRKSGNESFAILDLIHYPGEKGDHKRQTMANNITLASKVWNPAADDDAALFFSLIRVTFCVSALICAVTCPACASWLSWLPKVLRMVVLRPVGQKTTSKPPPDGMPKVLVESSYA